MAAAIIEPPYSPFLPGDAEGDLCALFWVAGWLVPSFILGGAVLADDGPLPTKTPAELQKALELDDNLVTRAIKGSEILTNLTYLTDMIGPRLTGSAALKRANDWAAAKMRDYNLSEVHLEAWSMPEGWQRGTAYARIVEPDNGRTLMLASMGWYPGTPGKIVGDVVLVEAKNAKELEALRGKLAGAIVLTRPPSTLTPWQEIEKPNRGAGLDIKGGGKGAKPASLETDREFAKTRGDFFLKEGVAVLLTDSAKHFNLLATTGSWAGMIDPVPPTAFPPPSSPMTIMPCSTAWPNARNRPQHVWKSTSRTPLSPAPSPFTTPSAKSPAATSPTSA